MPRAVPGERQADAHVGADRAVPGERVDQRNRLVERASVRMNGARVSTEPSPAKCATSRRALGPASVRGGGSSALSVTARCAERKPFSVLKVSVV